MKLRIGRPIAVVVILAFGVLVVIPSKLRVSAVGPKQSLQQQDVYDTPSPAPAPVQPIPYSHKTHLALGLQCQGCHTNPDPGRLMTFPATSKCMQCHATVDKDKPAIRKLASFAKSSEPIAWVRVYVLLTGVQWSHRKHIDAGMKCEMCHGQVAQMDVMTEVKSATSMDGCLGCHKIHNAPTSCVTCHPAWAPDMVVVKK